MKPSALSVFLAAGLVLLPHASEGQRIAPSPAFALFRPAPTLPPARPALFVQGAARDHFWAGVVIGGVIGAVFFAATATSFCGDEGSSADCFPVTLAAAPIGFVVGGFVGGLVGALIPKKPGPSTH